MSDTEIKIRNFFLLFLRPFGVKTRYLNQEERKNAAQVDVEKDEWVNVRMKK